MPPDHQYKKFAVILILGLLQLLPAGGYAAGKKAAAASPLPAVQHTAAITP